MRAWLFQDTRQKKRLGDKCPWSVGWLDPDGKRRSKRVGAQSMAEKFRRELEASAGIGVIVKLSPASTLPEMVAKASGALESYADNLFHAWNGHVLSGHDDGLLVSSLSPIDLPQETCVFWVSDRRQVLYVGKALNLRTRWRAHHVATQLVEYPEARLRWITAPRHVTAFLEETILFRARPLLNRHNLMRGE
jgi:hypothetical protein